MPVYCKHFMHLELVWKAILFSWFKIVCPIGRTFTLVNPDNHGLYDKTSGPGLPGEFTYEPGMIGYNEVSHLHLFYSLCWISEYLLFS
jgi:hypothetical protein